MNEGETLALNTKFDIFLKQVFFLCVCVFVIQVAENRPVLLSDSLRSHTIPPPATGERKNTSCVRPRKLQLLLQRTLANDSASKIILFTRVNGSILPTAN